ncbi:MAG: LamG-like jellyroll fold domain-containing protein, partial [Actinomycetota bacterium]|nr:LamG-like jellyroll fold domain-containing protein [Actinomycetota bacterium]
MALALTVGLPPGAVPDEGGFPLRALFSWLKQPAALADVLGLPVQEKPSGESQGHYVPADETSSDGGAGQKAGRGTGAVPAELPEPPPQKKFVTPVAPGVDSYDEKTSVRVPERSGERFTEYRNADGSVTRRLYGSRVNFRDADGRWQPIDTELTSREGRLETKANSVDVSLAPAGADDELATVTTAAGGSVALGVDGAAGTPAVADGSVATYEEILPSTDLEAEALADGLRSTIVLKERPAGNEWVLPLALDGLAARAATDGSVALADAAGEVALRMAPGIVEDSKVDPKSGSAAQTPVTLAVGAGSVTVSADPAWLADPAREYPVRIGATIVTGDARTDTFADADPATTNRDTDDLPVGTWKDESAIARSYIGFDAAAADGFGDKLVRSATLNLFHSWSADCGNQQPISVRRVTVPFDGTPLDDEGGLAAAPAYSDPIGTLAVPDNQPACSNDAGDRGIGKWWSVPLAKDAVTDWTAGEPTDAALALTTTETDAGAFKRFTSGNVAGGEFQPFVEVTAAENTAPQVNEQYPSYGRAVPTLTPELLADASDPDDGPGSLRYTFILYASDGKTEIGRSPLVWRKSWVVPAGMFKWAESYYWSVLVSDGESSNSEYLYKNLITTPVPQPAITSGLSQNSGRSFDPAAGNYTTSARDAIVTTVGPALEIVRYYNSNDPRTTQSFGAGWSSILDSKVTNRGNTVVLTYPNGREMAFGRNADGTFTSPAGRSAILNSITGGYRLWEKDGNRYEFLQAKPGGVWALSTFKDVHNRTLKLNWVSGRIDNLEAASGRKLYLTWDSTTAPKRVTQVSTDSVNGAANLWTYTYSGTALTTVCPPTSSTKCHSYQYADGSLYQTAVANNQPLSYYRLTETSGPSARSSVLENAGTDNGTYHDVTFNVAGPLAGSSAKAVGFNGSARVALPASKLAGDASNQAVSMWFKAAPSTTSRVLYGQSWQNSDNTTTKAGYNPTLYLGADGHLMGGFPVAPQPGTEIGSLTTPSSNECIGVAGNTATLGARLGLFGCTGTVSQQFSWTTTRELRVTTGGQIRCIAPENGDYGKVFVVTATCDGSAKLKWDLRANGEIVSDYSYMCFSRIEVTGQTYTGAIGQRPCDTRPRALWQRYFPRLHTAMKSGTILADNDWHHVVLSAAGNSQTMYIDGEVTATQTGLPVQDITPVYNYLGAGWLGGGWRDSGVNDTTSNTGYRRNFNGALSEVALFDTPVNAATAKDLYEANTPVHQLTKVLRPSGNPAAQVTYDPIDGRVSQVTDSNGATWSPQDPTVGGTTKVYESSVLAGVPNNYWRLNDVAATQAKNQVNGETATFNAVELGWNGPFWPLTTAANFDGFPSRVTARDPTTCGADCPTDMNLSAVSMWFKTSVNGYPLFSYGNAAIQSGTTTKTYTALYVDSEGRLRGQFGTSAVNPIRSAAKVNDSKWHHVALVTWDNNQSLYLDGKIQGSLAGAPVRENVAKYMYVGAGYLGGGFTPGTHETVPPTSRGWMGQIAEAATYSKPLDGKMVEAQFKARNATTATAVPSVTYSVQQPDHTAAAPVVSRDVHDLQGGRKLAEIDPLGNQTRYGYSTKGFLRTVTDPNGNMTINEHDVRGNVVSTATCQDRSADRCTTTYYTYFPDATTEQPSASVMNDRLLTKRGPGSANSSDDRYLTTYTYNPDNAVRISETDALGRKTTVEYTNGSTAPSGLPTKIRKPGGSVVTITYNAAGDLLSTVDPAGKRTEYEYDALGRTTKETEVVGGTLRVIAQYEYDQQDRVVKETGVAVTNHVTGAIHTPVTTTVYNDDGLPTSETVADSTGGDASRTVSFGYDNYGRRTTETDALGKTVTIGYDAYGRVASQTHADNSVVRTKYDPLGNELEVTVDGVADPVRKMAYDPAGRLASVNDAGGFLTKYEYTDNNLLRKVTRYDSANGTGTAYVEEQNAYDSAGNLTSQITNNGLTTTTRTYDAAGRGLTATLDPAGLNRTTSHTYSVNDDVLTTTLTTGNTVVSRSESMFDKLGRALAETTYTSAGLTPTWRWMFGEITAGGTADAAGNTRGVAGAGAIWSTERGGSVSLTGTEAAVTADQPVVDTSRSYTAGIRVDVGDRTADRTLLSMPAAAGRPAMELKYVTGNAFQLTVNGTTAAGAETALTLRSANGTVPAAGTWTHLAASYDAASRTARLYVNGVALTPATATDFVPVTAAKVQVGHQGSTAAQGLFDEAIAFQSALTATEAQDLSSGAVPAAGAKVVRTSQNLDADGSPVSATDARGHITYVTNDEAGRAAVLTAPAAASVTGEGTPVVSVSTTRAGYNTFGELTEQQDPLGRVSTTRYDAVGRPTETQLPDYLAPGSSTPITAKTTNAYNAVGQVESTTDPLGNTTSFEYDRFGRTTKVTAPDEGVSSFVYSDNGDLVEQTDPTGAKASASYDFMGRTLTSTQAVRQTGQASTTTLAYAAGPWPTTVTSAAGVVTTMEYNAAGEQKSVT